MPAYLCKITHTSGITGKNHRLYGAEKNRTKATASRKPQNSLKPRRQNAPGQQAKRAQPAGRAASHSENAAFCAHLIAWCIARRFCRFTPAGPPHFLRHAKSRPAPKRAERPKSLGNTAQFPPDGLSTAAAAAKHNLRCKNAR